MIHYHGVPINPQTAARHALTAGHAFVSFSDVQPLGLVEEVCQSFAIDNGAFSAWRSGKPITDWSEFYNFAKLCARLPSCDFAVIPDVIDGTVKANDALVREWPLGKHFGAPVWHMHEPLSRLERLAADWLRVCIGSSGEFASVGNAAWWKRMKQAMGVVCDCEGFPLTKLHGLRMLSVEVFSKLPFASADSVNIGRNVGIDVKWKGTYLPPTKEVRAAVMRARIEAFNSPSKFIAGEMP